MQKKGKVTSFIRCATSRYICFPLIFMITTISMLVTIFQHSYVTTPTRHLVRRNASAFRLHIEETDSTTRRWTHTTSPLQFEADEAEMGKVCFLSKFRWISFPNRFGLEEGPIKRFPA